MSFDILRIGLSALALRDSSYTDGLRYVAFPIVFLLRGVLLQAAGVMALLLLIYIPCPDTEGPRDSVIGILKISGTQIFVDEHKHTLLRRCAVKKRSNICVDWWEPCMKRRLLQSRVLQALCTPSNDSHMTPTGGDKLNAESGI